MDDTMTRLAIAFIIAPMLAFAHSAPQGWAYDPTCCSQRDCAPVDPSSVRTEPGGYRITLMPGDHPLVTTRKDVLVPYDDPRVLPSGDDHYHVCITPGQNLLCVYAPPMGF